MKGRALIMLGIAFVLAIVAVFVARSWMSRQTAPVAVVRQEAPLTTVVVASTTLQFGSKLSRENVREIKWPVGSVPPGAFKSIDEVIKQGEERVVLRAMETGEPVLQSKISGFGGRATLSAVIGETMRAVTIRANDVSGVAGFVLPGDRIDIILTKGEGDASIAETLMQNMKVLAVNQQASELQDKPVVARVITLEATPIESNKLILAQQVGQLSFTLRSFANSEIQAMPRTTANDLKQGGAVEVSRTPGEPVRPPVNAGLGNYETDVTVIRALTPTVAKVPIDEGE
jgi:pilus assembly protein CpaB